MSVTGNIAQIFDRIASAAGRARRHPGAIALMAVTKTVSAELVREAYVAGLRIFGESRIQELSAKTEFLRDLGDAEWHMIGHLQTNKAAKAVELSHAIDSVDSLRLARKLNSAAQASGRHVDILLEINIGGEDAKSGLGPQSQELQQILLDAPDLGHIRICGLMTIPPFFEKLEAARPYFRRLRELRDQIAARQFPAVAMH